MSFVAFAKIAAFFGLPLLLCSIELYRLNRTIRERKAREEEGA